MSAKVLLLSSVGWPSVARLAAGFAHAACTVEAVAPAGAAITASRYLARWHPYSAIRPRTAIQRAISSSRADILVCCDDRSLAQLLCLYERRRDHDAIRALVRRSLGNPDAIPRLVSRSGFIAEARSEGIRVPETLEVSDKAELDEALAILGFPAVLKLDGSWGGEGVVIARNAPEAELGYARLKRVPSLVRGVARGIKRRDIHFALDAIAPDVRHVSVQKFVSGTQAASAFAAWEGKVVSAIYYDVLIADGTIGPPNVIRRVDCPQLMSATAGIARRFGLSGIHGLDFMRDGNGAAHLIEINPRATQGSTLAFGHGRDLPAALAGCLQGNGAVRPAIPGDTVAIFPREWRRDSSSPFLLDAYHDVPWDDPGVLFASLGVRPPGWSRAELSEKPFSAKAPVAAATDVAAPQSH